MKDAKELRKIELNTNDDIVLTKEGNGTKVVWTLNAEMEYPSNLMKPMMDYWMGKSYEEGLQNLKKLSEKP